jgi:hypothetical protein
MNLRTLLLLSLLTFSFSLFAQNRADSLSFGFLADIYYATEPAAWNNESTEGLYYNYSKREEFNLNIAALTARYKYGKTRINLGLQAGTFIQRNSAADPVALKYLHEANIGWLIGKKQKWAIDLGLLPSHIGQETVIGIDQPTVTRSLIAENSPYFETGIRVSYTSSSKKFYFAQLFTNGWSNMYMSNARGFPSFGQQFTYSPFKNLLINWSTFMGDLSIGESYQFFAFQDFSVKYSFLKRFNFTGSFNSGSTFRFMVERKPIQGTSFALQYKSLKKWSFAGRYESYNDEYALILPSSILAGKWSAYSLNLDCELSNQVKIRFESKRSQQISSSLVDSSSSSKKHFQGFTAALQIKL